MSREIGEYMSREEQERQIATLTCSQCQKEFEVILPQVEVIQTLTVSMILMQHPNTQNCPRCGMAYQMKIAKVNNLETAWLKVEQKRESRIITPPANLPTIIPGR